MEKLIEITKQIMTANPSIILSGSLALNLQGIKTLRPPADIDILMPLGETIYPILGMNETDLHGYEEDDDYELTPYVFHGTKIYVFSQKTGTNCLVKLNRNDDFMLVHVDDIIKFKMKVAMGSYSASRQKNMDDIMYMLLTNKK